MDTQLIAFITNLLHVTSLEAAGARAYDFALAQERDELPRGRDVSSDMMLRASERTRAAMIQAQNSRYASGGGLDERHVKR